MISASYRLRVVGWLSYEADDDDDDVSGLLLSERDQDLTGDGTYFSSRVPSGLNSVSVVSGTGESGGA